MSLASQDVTVFEIKPPVAWRQKMLGIVMAVWVCLPSHAVLADDTDVSIDIWVQRAPLALVIKQIADEADKTVKITGAIEGQVSGRFTGNLTEALTTLSESHDILFDLQENELNVVSSRALSKISIFLPDTELEDTVRFTRDEAVFPGNAVSVEGVMVKVSGHPNFVKRIVKKIGAGKSPEGAKEKPVVAKKNTTKKDKKAPKLSAAASASKKSVVAKATDEKPTANAEKSSSEPAKPILSVTDIPGFHTF